MKAKFFLLLLAAVYLTPAPVLADSPEDAVRDLIARMRKAGDLSPLADQIDWDTRFEQMSADERKSLGLSSAAELREYYRSRAAANGADQAEKIEKDLRNSSRDGADQAKLVSNELDRQQDEAHERMLGTLFTVLRAEKKGEDKYLVTVLKKYKDEEEEVQMMVRKAGGTWLLDSGAALNPAPSKLAGGSPLGRIPEPAAALGQP